jgi:hypothetical protein
MAKNPPCCARYIGKLHHDQANLRKLAQKAALHHSRGRDVTRLRSLIEEAKVAIENDKQMIIEHEAEHAGEAGR